VTFGWIIGVVALQCMANRWIACDFCGLGRSMGGLSRRVETGEEVRVNPLTRVVDTGGRREVQLGSLVSRERRSARAAAIRGPGAMASDSAAAAVASLKRQAHGGNSDEAVHAHDCTYA